MNWHWSAKLGTALGITIISALVFWYLGAVFGLSVCIPLSLAFLWFTGYKNLFLGVLGGAITGIAWPATGDLTPLLFVGFVPLLLAEHRISQMKEEKSKSGYKIFGASYLFFVTFSAVSTWWIYYASATGLLMAVVLNALFMAMVIRFFHGTKRALGPRAGYFSLFIFWLAFEHLHLFWDFSYPWLNLGNGFANHPSLVQWYEITGVAGGTIWILGGNLLVFYILKRRGQKEAWSALKAPIIGLALLIVLPVSASLIRFYTYEEKGVQVEVVAVQPNIDPYGEKFTGNPKDHLERMLTLADSAMSPETDIVLFPETALQEGGLWENSIDQSYSVNRMRAFLEDHPDAALLSGMTSFKRYTAGEFHPETARKSELGFYYDAFNSSLYLEKGKPHEIYKKSKLLIGVERMPLTWLLKHFDDFIFDMGGTVGSLGYQEERSVFTQERTGAVMAPVICYESVFGEYVGGYVNEGANMIAIITNDGWWDDTPGHRQHKMYGGLRAIEHRRGIARSANTGTSCFIDQKGVITQETEWWVPDAIRGKVTLNSEKTFYTEYGDGIGRMMLFISFFVWLWAFVTRFKAKRDALG